jgi:hypothetical protein
MPTPSSARDRRGGRVETLIRIAAPALDLVLMIGDRVSRLIEPDDPDYIPARISPEGESAPRGLRPSTGARAAR